MVDGRTLQQILDLYGLAVAPAGACQLLSSGSGNRVYAVSTREGEVILRQSHPGRTRQWLDLEAAVLVHLARMAFPAVRQRPTRSGQPFVDHDGIFWAAFEYVDAALAAQPDDTQLTTMARLQARLHDAMAVFPIADGWALWAGQPRPRKTWAYIVPLADTLGFLDRLDLERRVVEDLRGPLADAILSPIRQCRRRLEQIIRPLPDLPGMLTHYDYGQYNVLFAADGRATVIDFDLLCWESPAANLARALSVVARRQWMGPFEPTRAAVYLAAYQSQRLLTEADRFALPGLLRLFLLQYVIFHALLCMEEAKTSFPDRWIQAMCEDLLRDDEFAEVASIWLA